jgi:crotonobetainyl-CoA:carnitine CoA-transferase CaiB-like acyl-CoA transferase
VEDLHAYFVAPNVGKEAITINLKEKRGQELLCKIIQELEVDVFMCNTLPKRYSQFGIDYGTLSKIRPQLIWCGISAFGPDLPDFAGYDPALQAMFGYMYLTGEPDRDPMLNGIPIIDLKAGDEAFTQVLLAMMEQGETGKGKRIDISMAQCATSWLITALPQLELAKDESELFTRSANEHRSFIPSNCYPSKDGHVYLAIGSDDQWIKLIQIQGFSHCSKPERLTNNGRNGDKENIYDDIRKGLQDYTTGKFIEVCREKGLAVAPVHSVKQVSELKQIKELMVKTTLSSGKKVNLFPAPMNTAYLSANNNEMAAPPRLGEHNKNILEEAGFSESEIASFKEESLI